ncbi:MAG: UxaA family hydrolase, partial [Pseudoalteromonas spongiae]
MRGYLRNDGSKGIRNTLVVVYLVECAHHVARSIVNKMDHPDVQLIGFPGCYPNNYALAMMKNICTHPNVGGVLLVSLGCEGFNREYLSDAIAESGRPVNTLVIQQNGGTKNTIAKGIMQSQIMLEQLAQCPIEYMH